MALIGSITCWRTVEDLNEYIIIFPVMWKEISRNNEVMRLVLVLINVIETFMYISPCTFGYTNMCE